jgi:hypothetical protein
VPLKPRYWVVLLGMLMVLGLAPLLATVRMEGRDAGIAGMMLPLFAVWAATDSRRELIIASLLGLASLVINAWATGHPGTGPTPIATGTALLFAAFTTFVLLRGVLRSRTITGDVLAGAMAAYLMLGFAWALVHVLAVQVGGGEYSVPLIKPSGDADLKTAIYFSFITLMTIGFGDITPVSPWSRSLTILEGFTGFVFGTVVLAALVAAHLHQRDR